MAKQVRRVLVDAVGTRSLELVGAVSPREQSHADCPSAASRKEIPDAVSDDDGVGYVHSRTLGGSEKQVGIGLGALNLVSSNHRNLSYLAVDPPHRQLDAAPLEGVLPHEDVL